MPWILFGAILFSWSAWGRPSCPETFRLLGFREGSTTPLEPRLKVSYRPVGIFSVPRKAFAGLSDPSLIPQNVRPLLGQYPETHGANCFAAALCFHGLSRAGVYLEVEMFEAHLNQYFDRLSIGDSVESGDLLIVASEGRSAPQHAMIYLGSGFVFHKLSMRKTSPYVIERLDDVASLFGEDFWMEAYRRHPTFPSELQSERSYVKYESSAGKKSAGE